MNLICTARDAYEILGLEDSVEYEQKILSVVTERIFKQEKIPSSIMHLKDSKNFEEFIVGKRRTGKTTRSLVHTAVRVLSGQDVLHVSNMLSFSKRKEERFKKMLSVLNEEFQVNFAEQGEVEFTSYNNMIRYGKHRSCFVIFDLD